MALLQPSGVKGLEPAPSESTGLRACMVLNLPFSSGVLLNNLFILDTK